MSFLKPIAAAASIAVAAFAYTGPAQANANDAIIAGTAGFAVGTLFGHATAYPPPPPRYGYYAPPRAVYVEPGVRYAPRRTVVTYGRPAPGTQAWYAYCSDKYRSFDPRSGTFIGRDGSRHTCR